MSEILLDWHDDAAVVTINRPDERNALGSPQLDELTLRLQEASERTSISALIITGTGTFCAGGDLKALQHVADRHAATPSTYDAAHRMIRALLAVPVPTIAAVDGAAVLHLANRPARLPAPLPQRAIRAPRENLLSFRTQRLK